MGALSSEAMRKKLGEERGQHTAFFCFFPHSQLRSAVPDSPQLRLLYVIILGVFFSLESRRDHWCQCSCNARRAGVSRNSPPTSTNDDDGRNGRREVFMEEVRVVGRLIRVTVHAGA